jgi:1-acyl-sn-glycerol-3-phosphate acyltransferase
MTDPAGSDLETGVTVEFSSSEVRERLPAAPDEGLRSQLPGLEPDRRVTDWGRSQRLEAAVDRTVYGFLYNYWFRVEVEGVENVPGDGGALLIANRAGTVAADAAMIAKAVREEHPRRRAVHVASERTFKRLPGIGMLATKIGAVSTHPANLQRLLFDERELVLVFPEGLKGSRKPLKERYRLREFDACLLDAARRAHVPVVPIAVIGGEESSPAIGRIGPLRRIPPLPLGPALPLPAKFRLRFLEPIDPGTFTSPQLAHELRGLLQENVLEMVAARRSVWLG